MKSLIAPLSLCVLIVVSGTCAAGSFTGKTQDLKRAPLANVLVEAIDQQGRVVRSSLSTADGTYTLANIPDAAGAISVEFSRADLIGTTINRLDSATVAGKMDVFVPRISEMKNCGCWYRRCCRRR